MAKTALITGASSGIGRATADRLAGSGWSVVGTSRRGSGGADWAGVTMDVDDDASATEGVTAAVRSFGGRLDALVANAGWGLSGAIEMTSIEQAKAQFETNFFGVHRVVRAALPTMRQRGGGRIVVISSIGGVIAIPYQGFYSASKFALEGYAEALGWEVAPFGIHVTIVQPGNVSTDFTSVRRDVPTAGGDDPYAGATARAVSQMEHDEANGASPEAVAATIERVLNSPKPPRRVSVGRIEERAGIVAKRVLPFGLFERAARKALGA